MPLKLGEALRETIVVHAREAAPNECCGLLAGQGDEVGRVVPLANAAASPTAFRADPAELLRAFDGLDAAGLALLGIYHSHPKSQAYPSPTDVAYARGYPGAYHVLVSLREPERPEVRAFLIEGERVTEVEIAG